MLTIREIRIVKCGFRWVHRADVREPEEVERLRAALPRRERRSAAYRPNSESGSSPHLAKDRTPLFAHAGRREGVGPRFYFEAHKTAAGIAAAASPLVGPEVEDVMHIHIYEERREHRPLPRTYSCYGLRSEFSLHARNSQLTAFLILEWPSSETWRRSPRTTSHRRIEKDSGLAG
jgi:hypothetical protein